MTAEAGGWKLVVSYDGTDYHGWQLQPGLPTVQGALERALGRLEGRAVRIEGSGRTDAGVHALAQVASCRLSVPIPPHGLAKALNRLLPPAIRVTDAARVRAGFHARHWAVAKTYEYRIQRAPVCPPFEARYSYWHPYPLDEVAMAAAAPAVEGERDFASMASNSGETPVSTVRTIHSSKLRRDADLLVYRVRGSGFLYRMVRNLVGTLLEVGKGNLRPQDLEGVLAARDRAVAGPTAPARGLYLAEVEYPDGSAPAEPRPLNGRAR